MMIKSPNPRNKTLYFLHLLSSTERADFKLLIYNENIILNILLLPFKRFYAKEMILVVHVTCTNIVFQVFCHPVYIIIVCRINKGFV